MYPVAEKLPNETERAAFVEALALIGTDQQDEFYSFCEIGKLISGFDKAMVSLIDSSNQCVLSHDAPEPFENKSWPVENSFCQHVIGEIIPTIVFDISLHPIFGKHPNVISGAMKGSYCGFPIRTSNNLVLGTYCLAHDEPIHLPAHKVDAIDKMVAKLGSYLERQSKLQAENSNKLLLGLKFALEKFPDLKVDVMCKFLEFRNGFLINSSDLIDLQNLGLIDDSRKLTSEGAMILEKLSLYQSSFKSKKSQFTNEAKDFDALFEGL
jgi:hypothetical protein